MSIKIPDDEEVSNNIERLRKEKETLEKEINSIDTKKQINMDQASKILNVRKDFQDKFIQRFFNAFRRKQNGLDMNDTNCDFEIKMKLLESEHRAKSDPNTIDL